MSGLVLASFLGLVILVVVHLLTPKLKFLEGNPRSVWLSFAGGVAVGYVFVHLLPELNRGGEAIAAVLGGLLPSTDHFEYFVALVGLIVFYGLDRLAKTSRGQTEEKDTGEAKGSPAAFWLHIGAFAVYNVLIGYLLVHREPPGLTSLAFFTGAMAVHFLVSDFGLLEDYQKRLYERYGRPLLALSVALGWGLGVTTELSEGVIATLTAFLAGGVIMNVFKEELPEERKSRFWPFFIGIVGYAALLLAI
jgi:hypothetical protein